MSIDGLYLFVEGADDERLLSHICSNYLQESYSWIKTYQYAQKKSTKVCDFINVISLMGADYIFFADSDLTPSILSKKRKLNQVYSNIDDNKLQIVVQEIESWYLAGLDSSACDELGVSKKFTDTELISKEKFDQLIPSHFDSRIDFMVEILKFFSIDNATTLNRSFSYFVDTKLSSS